MKFFSRFFAPIGCVAGTTVISMPFVYAEQCMNDKFETEMRQKYPNAKIEWRPHGFAGVTMMKATVTNDDQVVARYP